MKKEEMRKWLDFYINQGFSIIPIQKNSKEPNIASWNNYQYSKPSKEEIDKWFNDGLFDNIGVICGAVSGNLVVFDIDDSTLVDELGLNLNKIAETGHWIVQTGKGYHIYARHDSSDLPTVRYANLKIEKRGNGAYVVAPPSIHKNSKKYAFMNIKDASEMKSLAVENIDKIWNDLVIKVGKLKGIDMKTVDMPEPVMNIDADCIAIILKGVEEGRRNDTAFALTQYYHFVKKMSPSETKTLVIEWNKQNKPSLSNLEIHNIIRSALRTDNRVGCNKIGDLGFCPYKTKKECRFINPNALTRIFKDPPANLTEVHERIRKWIFMTNTDKIDLMLALVISNQSKDDPLWIFLMGSSGDAKTELVRALEGLPNVRRISQLTPKTFATGMKDELDLGAELANRSTILLNTDLAYLVNLDKNAKASIWSTMRDLYDGDIIKDSGGGVVNKKYENCHVTFIACTTGAIKDQYLLGVNIGTRELLYGIEHDFAEDIFKMKKALTHKSTKARMRQEIKETIQGYLNTKEFDESIELPEYMQEWLFDQCIKLAIMRATVSSVDNIKGEIAVYVDPEIPTRVIQQFGLLYRSLKSLEADYPDESFKRIIRNIVRSSGNEIRYIIYEYLSEHKDEWFTVADIAERIRIGYIPTKLQCEVLWNLKMFERKTEEDMIGGYLMVDDSGREQRRGGRIEKVNYYKFDESRIKIKDFFNQTDDLPKN